MSYTKEIYERWRAKNPDSYARNQAQQKARRDERRLFLDWCKDQPCMDCGVKYPPRVMDFDHQGDKMFSIARIACRKPDVIVAEVLKCEVVCANCHRLRTWEAA